jgi:hypothetical protein
MFRIPSNSTLICRRASPLRPNIEWLRAVPLLGNPVLLRQAALIFIREHL